MDLLAGLTDRRSIHKALDTLPSEVNATYDEAMKRIARQTGRDRILAEQVLSWVSYAVRPLSLTELQHALAISPDMTAMDPEAITDAMFLTSVCAGLVVIDEYSDVVRLARRQLFRYSTAI
jgi:tetrahydromethanopterin S-methyltransferase subunit G